LPKESPDNRQLLPMMLIESSSAEASQRLASQTCDALALRHNDVMHYALGWQLTAQEVKS
jgi:hypothetical protein